MKPKFEKKTKSENMSYRGGFWYSGLVQRARALRQGQTPAEDIFWELVRNRQLLGCKFRRQHQIGNYIVDFYCYEARLVIELDGPVHEGHEDLDKRRDDYLISLGNTVLRLTNENFLADPQAMLEKIGSQLALPHPLPPLPEGEGVQGAAVEEEASEEGEVKERE